MRRFIFSLVTALCLLATFTMGVSAHSTTDVSVRSAQKSQNVLVFKSPVVKITPYSSGGGCSQYRTNVTQDISVKACISYKYPYLLPDAYVSFFQHQTGGVNACSVQFFVYRSDGYVVDNQYKVGCVTAAVNNTFGAHFGPESIFDVSTNFSYYCYAQVNLYFNNGVKHLGVSNESPYVTP